MKMVFWFPLMAMICMGVVLLISCSADEDDDDDDDASATCDVDALQEETADLCGGEVRYTGTVDSDNACGATCENNEIGYWYDRYGACVNECFCCNPAI